MIFDMCVNNNHDNIPIIQVQSTEHHQCHCIWRAIATTAQYANFAVHYAGYHKIN